MDFTNWTRQDFIDFDNRRAEVFAPTQEELEAEQIIQEQARKQSIIDKLAKYWATRPDTITKEFCIWFLTSINAKEFIGDDYSSWVDSEIEIHGDIETAFDNLVYNRL